MFDPQTLAFEIRWPLHISIWHVDPLRFGDGRVTRRRDDSCGWFDPPILPSEIESAKRLAREQYSQIFERQVREREGAPYARICYAPSAYDAIYWSWRAIASRGRRGRWQYRATPSASELDAIWELASCPVDNLRSSFEEIQDAETFEYFFLLVYRAWRRWKRPAWRHPRWHFWHWRIQVHLWQQLRRWMLTRCEGCHKRFQFGESPVTGQWDQERPKFLRGESGMYHDHCFAAAGCAQKEPM